MLTASARQYRLFRVEQACAVIRDQTQRGGTFDLIPLFLRQAVQIVKRSSSCGLASRLWRKHKTDGISSCQAVSHPTQPLLASR